MTCGSCGRANRPGARFCDACGAARPAASGHGRAQGGHDRLRRPRGLDGAARAARRRVGARRHGPLLRRTARRRRGARRHGREAPRRRRHGGVRRAARREDDACGPCAPRVAMQRPCALVHRGRSGRRALGLRVGINTGEVVVSADTTDVVGDPVNVAARLQARGPRRRRAARRLDAPPGGRLA